MGIKYDVYTDEGCPNTLVDYVQRGELFGAFNNDRTSIWVNWGSHYGYPIGETFANIPVHHVKDLIAVLTAVVNTK